jgi:hypothetical protein
MYQAGPGVLRAGNDYRRWLMNKWTRTLTAAIAALATAVIGAPPGHAQQTTDHSTALLRHDAAGPTKVVNLRVGEHAHFDRVVIDVRGNVPGRSVRYVHRLRYDASGARVHLHGRRFLQVSLSPAIAHRYPFGRSVYRGPRLRQYFMPVLRGVAFTGDWEGVVSFGLALRRHVDFSVDVLHSPNRIVIDLHH